MISILNVRGGNHESCEDSVYYQHVDEFIYGGVFDGCSSAQKSHWASQTFAYMFSKGFKNPTTDARISGVWARMHVLVDVLGINEMNLVSTALVFAYDTLTKEFKIRCFGDGYYYINDVEYEIDQDNEPDYLAYRLRDNKMGEYLEKYPLKVYQNVDKFIVCSDGIKRIDISQFKEPVNKDPYALLFAPPSSDNYLQRMWNKLKRDGYTLSDDLSIISYVNENISDTQE